MSEPTVHPMFTNIRALADATTWQESIDLAGEALLDWSKTPPVIQQVYLVGNGQVGQYIIEHIAGIPSKAIPAFAFSKYMEPGLLGPQTLVIGISTTGETQSVCEAIKYARQAGSSTLAITAHKDSAIAQNAEAVIFTGGFSRFPMPGEWHGVAGSVMPVWHDVHRTRGAAFHLAAQGARQFLQEGWDQIKQLAEIYSSAPKVFVLGTGPNLGTAEEASLKVIEMAKMYSECQELEDFFHGRLREVDQNSPLFFIAPQGRASRRVLDFLTVMDTIHAPAIVITDQVTPGIQRLATQVIQIPISLDEFATPLLYILPMYIFGYEMALQRGYDPTARRYDLVPQNVRYQGEE